MRAMPSALVLCAGFGTRLRPLTDELPKPLVPVGDRSILEHALDRLSQAGITEIAVNVHHLASAFEERLTRAGPKVRYIVEPAILGTAGGVAGARRVLPSAPLLVWNGDVLLDPPLDLLLARVANNSFCLAVAPRAWGEGTLGLDEQGRVVRLRGEQFGREQQGGDYVGVLALGAELADRFPERGCSFGDVALPLLRSGGTIQSVPVRTPWIDAGDCRALLAANMAWLADRGLQSYLADSAELAPGVTLSASLVGARARVRGSGALQRCVVCPGASVTAPLSDAIIAPSGRVIPIHV